MNNPQKILNELGIKYQSIWEITHDDSLSSKVYRVFLDKKNSCILKYSYDSIRYKREIYYLDLLKDVIPVPKIIDLMPPLGDFQGAFVMEDVKGELLKGATLSDHFAAQMGENLAKLHLFDVKYYGDLASDKDLKKGKDIPMQLMKKYLEENLIECSQIVEPSFLDKIAKYADSNLYLLNEVDGPHIVHRDYRPGNIIAKKNKIQAVIDFEITKASFAEEDVMQMEMLVWNKYPNSKTSFLAGYSNVRPLPNILEVTPLLKVFKALGAIGFTFVRNSWKDKHKFIYDQNIAFLKELFLR